MTVHGYEVDFSKGFTCTRRNDTKVFQTYEQAVAFIQSHYGYILTYHIIKPIEEKKVD